MPMKRVFSRFRRAKGEPEQSLDVVLKDDLAETIERLQQFTRQIRADLDYVEKVEDQIPDELLEED